MDRLLGAVNLYSEWISFDVANLFASQITAAIGSCASSERHAAPLVMVTLKLQLNLWSPGGFRAPYDAWFQAQKVVRTAPEFLNLPASAGFYFDCSLLLLLQYLCAC